MWLRKLLLLILFVLAMAQTVFGQSTTDKPSLNLAGARAVLSAAVAKATELQAPGGSFAVVDDGGNLLALERIDGTFAASAAVSIGKARTAALFKKPTKFFEEVVNKGRTSMVALSDFTPLQGGVPVLFDGHVVGAIGVSGAASADQDEVLAQAGAAAFAMAATKSPATQVTHPSTVDRNSAVTHLDHERVAKAFDLGMPLLENENFKVHASRRVQPGMAEVHDDETDVVYVVAGTATLVTGGKVIDPKSIAPGETRGSAIEGGQSISLAEGDVVVIPDGTPHWFQSVDGPFLYFVVKPSTAHGANR
jgi:glc operon protein GlcG